MQLHPSGPNALLQQIQDALHEESHIELAVTSQPVLGGLHHHHCRFEFSARTAIFERYLVAAVTGTGGLWRRNQTPAGRDYPAIAPADNRLDFPNPWHRVSARRSPGAVRSF
jgi:hypothetical protein